MNTSAPSGLFDGGPGDATTPEMYVACAACGCPAIECRDLESAARAAGEQDACCGECTHPTTSEDSA